MSDFTQETEDYLPEESETELVVIETIDQDQTHVEEIITDWVSRVWNIILNWPNETITTGSEFNLKVYRPDQTRAGEWQSEAPPINVGITVWQEGTWRFEITAVDVPHDDYPFALVVGSAPFVGYEYLPGDVINMANGIWSPSAIGGDVTYLVNYFKGSGEACLLDGFWASADVNADCIVMGSDVVRLVAYFRGSGDIEYCADHGPAWLTSDDLSPVSPISWPNCGN